MREMLTRSIGWLIWPLIKCSSVVTFDRERGKVSKVYYPRIFIRILHFLAFQKWTFLYETELGLKIAGFRREIAKYVLMCGMGRRCRIASFLGVESQGGKLAFITELIKGREPRNQAEVSELLQELTALFVRAGLPTWSICTHNPRAYTNIVIGFDGTLVVVDLESLLINICIPLEELWNNIKAGNFPPFDDICFPKLWQFYHEVRDSLEDGGERLRYCIKECEGLTKKQKKSRASVMVASFKHHLGNLRSKKGVEQ